MASQETMEQILQTLRGEALYGEEFINALSPQDRWIIINNGRGFRLSEVPDDWDPPTEGNADESCIVVGLKILEGATFNSDTLQKAAADFLDFPSDIIEELVYWESDASPLTSFKWGKPVCYSKFQVWFSTKILRRRFPFAPLLDEINIVSLLKGVLFAETVAQ